MNRLPKCKIIFEWALRSISSETKICRPGIKQSPTELKYSPILLSQGSRVHERGMIKLKIPHIVADNFLKK